MPLIPYLLIIFLAVFTQSLSGFGVALVAMSLLTPLIGIHSAAPLVALLAISLEIILLIYYRSALNVRAVWPLVLSSIVGVPLGVLTLKQVDEEITLSILGLVVLGYALYGLLKPSMPELRGGGWGYLMGFLAGILGGAYNTSGPPVILYGDLRGWQPDEFKGNLQGFFLINSLVVVFSHAWAGNLTPDIWQHYLAALPVLALGCIAGIALYRVLNPAAFRKIVLGLLILLGINLIFF
jgi:uncharacterized membrane protein YfcA